MLRNETIVNVYVRHCTAEVEKCWTRRPHEGYDTRTHILVLWSGGDNLDDRAKSGEVI